MIMSDFLSRFAESRQNIAAMAVADMAPADGYRMNSLQTLISAIMDEVGEQTDTVLTSTRMDFFDGFIVLAGDERVEFYADAFTDEGGIDAGIEIGEQIMDDLFILADSNSLDMSLLFAA